MKTLLLVAFLGASSMAVAGNTYEGPWPPYSGDQCYSAAASGELARRELTLMECKKLAENEGKAQASANATAGSHYILEFGLWDVDSAGGIEPHLWAVNANTKSAIKYIVVDFSIFNGVGDKVRSDIGGHSSAGIRATGPLASADGPKHFTWDPVAYNHSAGCLQAESVKVQFMDGKQITFRGPNLKSAFAPGVKFRCK